MATEYVKGGDGLAKALADIARKLGKGGLLKVGFLEDQKYPDGTPVAQAAFFDNFGTSRSPARPFFTNMVEAKQDGWGDMLVAALAHTNNDVGAALDLVGDAIEQQLQQAIADFSGAPLSKVTLLLRSRFPTRDGMTAADVWQAFHDVASGDDTAAGSDKQLVWSGIMLRSTGHEVDVL